MHQALSRLIVYRNLDPQGILLSLAEIVRRFEWPVKQFGGCSGTYTQIHRLLDVSTNTGLTEILAVLSGLGAGNHGESVQPGLRKDQCARGQREPAGHP
jgi:hypothetical protein